jgi:hypothetical protein
MQSSHKWLPLYLSVVALQMRGLVLDIGCVVWEIDVAEGGSGALLVPRPSRGRSYVYDRPHL